MESHRNSQEKQYCCCFSIEEGGSFVAWTSLIFGFFYVIVTGLDLLVLLFYTVKDSIFYFSFFFYIFYFIHSLTVIASFVLIKKAIKLRNPSKLSLPIVVQAIGTLIIVYQFFPRWNGYWDQASFILLAIVAFSAFVVIYFLFILVRLHSHLRRVNLIGPQQTPQFVIQRQPPPNYNNSVFVVQPNVTNENPQFSMEPPAYHQIFTVQSQNLSTQNENKI